jgi:hypothetical protein
MESHTVSAADAYLNIPRHKLAKRLKDPRKVPVVLLACGSFSPVTFLHLRLFGKYFIDVYGKLLTSFTLND